ncbi:hypothetical protein [Variovorax sp. 54]|uniref:hypothetical protein n=1 Tax=Variovorax sp. 54 TaxID=2035212 RepID=UPI00117BFE37|nr:hypothetical protein [Variovorax sp. 54]
MRPDHQFEAWAMQLQRDAQIFIAINLIAGIAVLALMCWGIAWSISVVRRWEQREEAKLRAFQRFVANMSPKESPNTDYFRAD